MRILLQIFIVLILSGQVMAQKVSVKIDTVDIIYVKETRILSILDSLLQHEKYCDYYDPELILKIHIRRLNSDSLLVNFGSTLGLSTLGANQVLGGFNWKGHYTEVTGNHWVDSFFNKTNKKREIERNEPIEYYDSQTGEKYLNYVGESKTTLWFYMYINNQFNLMHKDTQCN